MSNTQQEDRSTEEPLQTQPRPRQILGFIGLALLYLVAALLALWAVTALYIDLRHPVLSRLLSICYLCLIIFLLVRVSGHVRRLVVCAGGFMLVLVWWLSLSPSNNRPWQADVS